MKPSLPPSSAPFVFTVILSFGVHFPAIWCQETQRPFDICGEPVDCGEIPVEYPFWGLDRPAYCGHPGFQLTCPSNVPLLNYESVNYRVLRLDTSTQIITIARNDLWESSCPRFLYNTSYNSMLFNGDNFPQLNVSLYYDCNTSSAVIPLSANYRFSCNVNESQSDSYFIRTDQLIPSVANFLDQCQNRIDVPVNQSSGARLASGVATTDDLRSGVRAGFQLQWTAKNDECDRCIRSNGQCGSNWTSPDLFACYCSNGNFSFTCNDSNGGGGGGSKGAARNFIIGISCSVVGILFMMFVIIYRKKRLWETLGALRLNGKSNILGTTRNHQIEIFIRNYGTMAPNRFKYSQIKKMTSSFDDKLGQGGYGSVYKGQLSDGKLVAVKLLGNAIGDGNDFINEVASIGRTSHVNIVKLLGFCFDGKKRALMYEFMPNGSLDKFLRGDGSHLDWNTLFQIAKGIARGLEYLHQGCNTRIVHFDIKPHNILLDEEFVPKISDFGLAKLCKRKESIVSVTGARGTAGYMAPEVFFKSFGGASHKSDVYSYGMMVLEMTGARKKNKSNTTSMSEAYFPDWIYKKVETGDNLGVDGVTTEEEEELARKLVMVSLWCIQSDPSDRPSISKVVEMLEGSFQSLQVPPRRFWSSPARHTQDNSPSASQSLSSQGVLKMQATEEESYS
ncbi:unnamed protein product [Lactuca virosa]|uniref:non-specific serine/threonine protein kinase n=1 Tax=Lactuca virosa TaxID=75947 RepID=A0AAU9M0L9_9ASTR|nr:unnamed protein product [Lactuca virosa]